MRGLFFLFMGMMIAVVAPEEAMAVFTQVAAGGYHSVALMEDGTVMTWGDNGNGQLGDGTTTDRLTPVLVPGLTGVKAIAAGWLHSMALLTNGTVMTWGSNGNGQLGDGTTTYRSTPVRVLGLTGVKSIAAGLIHSMAILNDGTVMTWGLNRDGQLGDGTTTDRLTPVFVPGLTGVNSIAAGSRFSLALLNDGTVRAWGSNNYGQLGDGTRTDRLTPVPVSRLSGVVALAAGGEHTVALLDTGTLMAWGKSLSGQLGTQNIISTIPALVQGLAGVTAIATGDTHTVALLGDGTVKAWGDNSLGQMGDGTTTDRFTLFSVPGMSNVKTLAGGYYHSLALLRDGTIMAWGSNSNGQLGNGTKRNRLTPTEVPAVAGAANIVAGWQHTLALLRDGTARAWGLNSEGQLGDGTRTDRFTPVMVPGLVGAVDIAASWGHNVALMTDGTVRAWGWNIFGQLGDGTTNNHFTPVQVPGLVGAIDIAAGGAHTVALLNNGTVMTWGANGQGALGDGTTTNRLTPVPVPGLAGVKAVVAGDAHTLVLLQDGTVRAWGINDFGQLGDGTTTNRLTPVPVPGIAGVKAVSTGVNHTVALMTDGTVRAWGRNSEGELGDGTGLYRLSPTPVPNLASVSAIAVGSYHTLVLLNDGTLKTWGYNEYGQLGDGTTINRFTPVPVPGVTNALAIAAGASHSLALLRDGTVMSWGYNGFGQLGSGWSTAPTVVGSPLTITKEGGGVGAVTASSGTIAWDGNQGQTLYPYGATITLSAKPSACSEFTGWSGDCTGTGVCTVTMDIPKNVTATFVAHPDLLTAIFYRDADGDGYGNPAISTAGCPGEPPLGYVTDNTDCNDAVPSINSGASEICDGIDNNCNGLIDDADPNLMAATFWFADADADTYGNPNVTKKSCARPVGYVADKTDCNDADPASYPGATEICNDGIDNNCDGKIDAADPLCSDVGGIACLYDAQCGANEYCMKKTGDCNGVGQCWPLPAPGTMCPLTLVYAPVCGCDGKTYPGACEAGLVGVNVAAKGECATAGYKWTYYFPAAKDNDAIGWENYLSVQAKNPVAMDVTIRAYDMNGVLKGTYVYSDTVTGANAPAIAPNARVAQRPSWIAGSMMSPIAIEGSLIVETSVPAIASTNFIANFYKGFSIYEAAKVRPVHYFPKAFDGPNNYQVYMLVQNIYDAPRNVTVKLFGKNVGDPGDGMARTVDIPAHGTLKVRPSEIAGGIDFNGSVVVYSNQAVAEDGLGLPIPAMCSYEAGAEALAIYESTARQPQLAFPVLKDGKFGGTIDYQNFLSVVNMNPTDATITMILYNKAGVEEGRLASDVIPSGGKKTWRLGWIKGTMAAPLDFEGSVIVTSDKVLIGQTNTIYPGANKYGADGFDLIESAMPAANLFFPKAFDNLLGSGTGATHLIDNFVYVQNLDGTAKNFKIEQFNNNGTANGYAEVALAPNATYVYRPKELVTDGTSTFRGSVKVTERSGKKITGAIKYEVHKTTVATSAIDAMTIYRSMGQ